MAESTPNPNTEESVMDYSHEYEVLMKDVRNVTFELNVAEFIDVKNWYKDGAVYGPGERKKIYVGNLKTLLKRLAKPLSLPFHSKEFSDDVAQLHSDVKQVLRCHLIDAHKVTFPRVSLGGEKVIAKPRRNTSRCQRHSGAALP